MCIAGGTASAANSAAEPVVVMNEFHAKWATDSAYIDKLARDTNPRYAANKRLVLEFEAALEHAQTLIASRFGKCVATSFANIGDRG